jgi:hypothetical protein
MQLAQEPVVAAVPAWRLLQAAAVQAPAAEVPRRPCSLWALPAPAASNRAAAQKPCSDRRGVSEQQAEMVAAALPSW